MTGTRFVILRKRCLWADHHKCAIYDRMSEDTLVCCRGGGWIIVMGKHKGGVR